MDFSYKNLTTRRDKDNSSTMRRRRRWGDLLAPYIFASPFIISFLVLFLGPAIYSLVLSFYRYRGYGQARFVGFDNYEAVLNYHVFWTMLNNTIVYWLAHVFPLMIFAFLLAVLVRSKLIKGKRFFKPLIFMPNIVAVVAAALVFQSLFGTTYGVINNLFGLDVPWLQQAGTTRIIVVIMMIWRGLGWWFVIFLAGLTSINPEVEEAATVDGASPVQTLLFVTIPLMRKVFLFAFVIDAINSFRLFAEPNVLVARGGELAPNDVAPVLNLLLLNLQNGRFGMSAASGWIIFLLIATVSFLQFFVFRDRNNEAD